MNGCVEAPNSSVKSKAAISGSTRSSSITAIIRGGLVNEILVFDGPLVIVGDARYLVP